MRGVLSVAVSAVYIFIGVLVLAGTIIQGTIGFGLGTIATPIIALIKPDLLPAVLLILAFFIAAYTLMKNRAETEWRLVGISSLARLPGSLLGAWSLTVLSLRGLQLFIGCAVILAMSLSWLGWTPRHNNRNTLIAGVASGFLGTTTSIGGPPMALVLKRFNPAKVRGTLSATFVIGCLISLTILTLSQHVTMHHVVVAGAYLPLAALGLFIAGKINRRIDTVLLNKLVVIVAVSASLLLIGLFRFRSA
ncbi:sulfite exporter TauE/SafE family protein [Corynebacterium hindlerae]|nr:sulfite exporter TauE/SafE family protein [Corynebacterium hindlerae]